jgi:hypothetical protein
MSALTRVNTFQHIYDERIFDRLPKASQLDLASHIFETFGLRYAAHISNSLRGSPKALFDQIWRSHSEIQHNISRGTPNYTSLRFPETAKIIEQFREESRNDDKFYLLLRRWSFNWIPFPQRIFTLQEPDWKILEAVEKVRRRAFGHLVNRLAAPEENKEAPLPQPAQIPLSEEIELSALYFRGGALIRNRVVYYFSDMVGAWSRRGHRIERARLLESLNYRSTVEEKASPPLESIELMQGSFPFFLAQFSVLVLAENLKTTFSLPLKNRIINIFMEDEKTRSYCSYFTADLERLYVMDLARMNRHSAYLILSIQLLIFFVQNYGVRGENRNLLFEMIFFRRADWKAAEVEGFDKRRWDALIPDSEANEFEEGWSDYLELLDYIPGDKELKFRDPFSWPLFSLIWTHPHRKQIVLLCLMLSHQREVTLSLEAIYQFCRTNLSLFDHEAAPIFIRSYQEVLKQLEGAEHGEKLFLDPPINLAKESTHLGHAENRAKRFVELAAPYRFPRDGRYMAMVRRFIFSPCDETFTLLRDAPILGIQRMPSEAVYAILLSPQALLAPGQLLPEAVRQKAASMAARLREAHQFIELETFSLYREIIRLALEKAEDQTVGRMSQVIYELNAFCPSIERKDRYFLFLYHPDVSSAEVASFVDLRRDWARAKNRLNRFIISGKNLAQILDPIQTFVDSLGCKCDHDEEREQFKATFRQSLVAAFFAPLQALLDYFRISNITADRGITWADRVRATHLGELKFLLAKSTVGIYFHWTIQSDKPVFFLSFFDMAENRAQSIFIPIDVSIEALLEDDNRRKAFYTFLFALSQRVLREEADRDMPEDAPEGPESWALAFDGVDELFQEFSEEIKQGNLTHDQIAKMWDFIKKAKVAYRKLFLNTIEDQYTCSEYEPRAVAAMGHIFPSHPKGALLPEALLRLQKVENFIPDGTDEFVSNVFRTNLFSRLTERPEGLNLNLNVMGLEPIPILYHVENILESEDRIRYVTLGVARDGIRVPLKYPDAAFADQDIFTSYLRYHLLLLKAFVYRAL